MQPSSGTWYRSAPDTLSWLPQPIMQQTSSRDSVAGRTGGACFRSENVVCLCWRKSRENEQRQIRWYLEEAPKVARKARFEVRESMRGSQAQRCHGGRRTTLRHQARLAGVAPLEWRKHVYSPMRRYCSRAAVRVRVWTAPLHPMQQVEPAGAGPAAEGMQVEPCVGSPALVEAVHERYRPGCVVRLVHGRESSMGPGAHTDGHTDIIVARAVK